MRHRNHGQAVPGADPEPQQSTAQVLTLKTKEDSNQQQVATLLSIMQAMQPFLLEPRRSIFSEDVPGRPELDGGASASASATFSALCNRLDAVLADKKRWDASTFYSEFEKEVLAVHKAQREFLQAQLVSARQLQRPSFQLKPSIAVTEEFYIAYWGDMTSGHAIVGQGLTPEAALLDFDAAFKRTPGERIRFIAEESKIQPDDITSGGVILPPSFPTSKTKPPENPDER